MTTTGFRGGRVAAPVRHTRAKAALELARAAEMDAGGSGDHETHARAVAGREYAEAVMTQVRDTLRDTLRVTRPVVRRGAA